MEKQPRLTTIDVSYEDSTNVSFNDILKRKKFIDSLAIKPLSSINHIHVGFELHLMIEHDNSQNKWQVVKDGEIFFLFQCENDRDIIDIFEENLKKRLCEISHPLENDANVSMYGE